MIFKAYTDLRQELKKHHAFGIIESRAAERFRQALANLKPKIGSGETEEDEKTFVGDFLKEGYYAGNYAIRIGARHKIDCQIHVTSDVNSQIGVIIENKYSKSRSKEMVKDGDLQHKAFYETILYYLREREAGNNSLRRIVITNLDEWFIFDALDYNRIFYKSPALMKKYRDYVAGRVSDASTNAFYDECEKFVRQSNITLRYAYFKFNELAYTKAGKVRENITDLYYLLSPFYLLKEDNDNKTVKMQSAFYNELLYIMGLGEVTEGNTKFIRRLPAKKRKEGSLVENVISFIKSHGLTSKLTKFYGDKTAEDMLFSTALNLSITWINRLLFLKLLEGQLLSFHNDDRSYKFLNPDRGTLDNEITYDDIDDLFFYVLGVPEEAREKIFSRKFAKVPYLNSSLFEPTEMEKEIMFIGNLNQNFPLPLYASSVLNGDVPSGVEYNSLQYLLHFLDKFKFGTSDKQNAENPDRLISASVLGYIFEKINGYQDGSFYTPEHITQYMCDGTIEKAVIARFRENELFAKCQTITEIHNAIEDTDEANKIFYSVKICDPAVGSGHFLVSALNKMLALRRDLGLMKDEGGKLITRSVNIDVMTDDLRIVNCDNGQPFHYTEGNAESQRIQKTLFNEKKAIIENCLFGVDINPNAANICSLRLWIELLKSSYYNEDGKLQTLPNIDINIKCGDSLIQKYPVRIGKSVLQNVDEESDTGKRISQYAALVEQYKETNDKAVKAQLKSEIKEIKLLIGQNAEPDLFGNNISEGTYHNSFEWMLEFPEAWNERREFTGFDVVIGNPPYIFNRNLDANVRDIYARNVGKTDSYVYFVYLGLAITKENGILSFITPNTYFTLTLHEELRKEMLKYDNIEFAYSGNCFPDAYVETVIFQLNKNCCENGVVTYFDSLEENTFYECDKQIYQSNILSRIFVPNEQNMLLYEKIQLPLKPLYEQTKATLTRDSSIASNDRNESIQINGQQQVAGSLTFLGLISDGDQGLVTGNNSKYIGVVNTDSSKTDAIDNRFLQILNQEGNMNVDLDEFRADRQKYYDKAEELKTRKHKPSLFGMRFIYKVVNPDEIKKYEDLSPEVQRNGTDGDCWIGYSRGNAEGLRWDVPITEVINWRKDYVHELRTSDKSRWQGEQYYSTTGFGWVDYFTDRLKGFQVGVSPYSKNVIKMHSYSPLATDKFIIAVLNSDFMATYVKNMITCTHTLQINDGRLIPIVIPTQQQHDEIVSLARRIMAGEDEQQCMEELNEKVKVLFPLIAENRQNIDKTQVL